MLISTFLRVLEPLVNRYLRCDQESFDRLTALAGKVVAVEMPHSQFKVYFILRNDGVVLRSDYAGHVDTTLSGTPFGLLKLYARGSDFEQALQGKAEIKGDLALGQEIQAILANLEIDWEEQVPHLTGDVIAHQLGNWGRQLSRFASRSTTQVAENTSEYLREEAQYLPNKIEVAEFLKQVDELRDDVDRLEARFQRLVVM